MLDLAYCVGLGRAPLARPLLRMTFAAVALSLAATALAQSAPDTSTSVVLVLDASGSMFNELPDG
ncbi:MAG TPA: hypothetical protein VFF10_07465, partial [Trueperaceae bacterium]|nr:hypothetical protein [Trueperaceae bacterium]